jgi:hypothetical protein
MELAALKHFLASTSSSWMLSIHERTWVNYSALLETLRSRRSPDSHSLLVAASDYVDEETILHNDGGWAISRKFAREMLNDSMRWMRVCTDETTRAQQITDLAERYQARPKWTPDFIGIQFNDDELDGILAMNFSRIETCKLPLISKEDQKSGKTGNFVKAMSHVSVWSLPGRKFFLRLPPVIPQITHLGYSYIDGQGSICSF